MRPVLEQMNALESEMQRASDAELRAKSEQFRQRIQERLAALPADEQDPAAAEKLQRATLQEALDELLPEAFAVVREAGRRTLNMRHFDVQLKGGAILHNFGGARSKIAGKIAEMKTGEGKTLVATLPAYLNALAGKGVHVVTVNDYLARRDSEWMGRIYRFLGMTVGVIQHDLNDAERQVAYACDITYGTNNEFGFA